MKRRLTKLLCTAMAVSMAFPGVAMAADTSAKTAGEATEAVSEVTTEQEDQGEVMGAGYDVELTDNQLLSARMSAYATATYIKTTWNDSMIRYHNSFNTKNRALIPMVDVSKWQETIDFKKVKQAGIPAVYLRAAYRGASNGSLNKDAKYEEYYKKAKAAGLKVGVYIYSQAINESEARKEFDYLKSVTKGDKMDLPYVFDYEYFSNGRLLKAKLSKSKKTAIAKAFCNYARKNDCTPMIYAGSNFLVNSIDGASLTNSELLWGARYNTYWFHTSKDSASSCFNKQIDIWQCDHQATVSGINKGTDFSYWYDPYELDVSVSDKTLKEGDTAAVKASTSTELIGKNISESYTYKTSDSKIASITSKGKITAKSAGKATITVTGKKSGLTEKETISVSAATPDPTPDPEPTPDPTPTTSLSAPAVSVSSGKLTWKAVSGATGYKVYKIVPDSTAVQVTNTKNKYYTPSVSKGNETQFYVRAYSKSETSAPSNVVAVMKTISPTFKVITINGNGTIQKNYAYKLDDGTAVASTPVSMPLGEVYAVKAVASNYYKTNSNHYIPFDNAGIYVNTPSYIKATKSGRKITVKWGKVTGAKSYILQRKKGSGSYTTVKTTTSTSFSQSLKNGTYTYRVQASQKVATGKTGHSDFAVSNTVTIR